jgi:hypothetical protein
VNFRDHYQGADTDSLWPNYPLLKSSNDLGLLMKNEKQAEVNKLHFWPKVQFGPDLAQIGAHFPYPVARHVLDEIHRWHSCRAAARPRPCHAPLPSPCVYVDAEAPAPCPSSPSASLVPPARLPRSSRGQSVRTPWMAMPSSLPPPSSLLHFSLCLAAVVITFAM